MDTVENHDVEILKIISHISDRAGARYAEWADRDDIYQELYIYYCDHRKRMLKWLEEDEKFRLFRALFGAAKQYAEREKATKSGYHFEDVAWYDPVRLEHLIPLALNPGWDGLTGEQVEAGMPTAKGADSESGTLLAMVCDVRRVIGGQGYTVAHFDSSTEGGRERLEMLCQKLGGEFPKAPGYEPGRRRAISNQRAIQKTENTY